MHQDSIDDIQTVISVGQLAGTHDIEQNLASIERLARTAASHGSRLIVLPEAVMYAYTESGEKIAQIARQWGHKFESALKGIADRHGISLLAGAYLPTQTGRSSNTLILARPGAEPPLHYNKLHLYDAFDFKESEKHDVTALKSDFSELVTFDLDGFTVGILNCYDLRFPEMARLLVEKGAEVLVVSSGWVAGPLKELQWETLLRARAIENTCFVAGSCQPAPLSAGLSMIIDPMGAVTSGAHEGEALATSILSKKRLKLVRDKLPCLEQRRYLLLRTLAK